MPQGYLGIVFRDVPEEQVAAFHIRGEEVVVVDHDGPACKAGLRERDVLLQIDGHPIEGEEALRRILRETPAGRRVTFTISREGLQQTLTIQLANRETVGQEAWDRHLTVPEPPPAAGRSIGFMGGDGVTLADLTRRPVAPLNPSFTGALLESLGPQLAEFFGAQTGLLVREVEADSPAAAAGLRAGDVVIRVDSRPIASGADWMNVVRGKRGHPIPVVVLRDKREQTLTLIPDARKRSSLTLPAQPEGTHDAGPALASDWRGPNLE